MISRGGNIAVAGGGVNERAGVGACGGVNERAGEDWNALTDVVASANASMR